MADNNLNIRSSTIEKGLELAKEFLDKLISPAIEETGLLISDNIKYLRFKNQIRTLLKAKEYVEKRNISVKEIPIKILVPLLENASLEEDEDLQEKWAKMIVNMADSETNFQNQIFPYLLSQISIQEYQALAELYQEELSHKELCSEYDKLTQDGNYLFTSQAQKMRDSIEEFEQEGYLLGLDDFECSNIVRLGLVRQLPPKIQIQAFQAGGKYDGGQEWHQLNATYDHDNFAYRITELGEKFIEVCELADKKK